MTHSFIEILKPLNNMINKIIREFTQDFSLGNLAILILISFIYGIIHSLGPGHGKLLVTAFFQKKKETRKI